jgi:hypothetical protein
MAQTLKFGNKTWATKVGSTLAYNDENGNYKPLPFAFTRSTSATRVNKEGLIEVVTNDRPRIDYTDTSDGVLLLENAATNLLEYSEDFSQSYWTKSNATITSNSVISPEGTLNASKVTEQNVSGVHYVGASLAGGAGEYTWSCFLKQGTSRYAGMRAVVNGFQNRFFVNVDLSNGSVVDTHTVGSGTTWEYYVHKYTNGWYRLVIQAANGSGNMDMSISSSNVAQPNYSLGLPTYLGSTNNNFYIWGAQFEIGSVASSYIPTQGSAVTRVAETASGAGNSEVFNDSEGVLFVEMSASDNNSRISLSDGSTSNRVSFKITDDNIDFQYRVGGNYSYRVNLDVNNYLNNKILMSYNNGLFVGYLNGFPISNKISGVSLGDGVINRLNLNDGDASDGFKGRVKEIGYYDTALTDLELETLTSYRSWESMVNELNLNIIYNG